MQISVILTVYNKAQYLRQCIESVLKQSYNNLEILIINDGSTDNSANIIMEYLYDPRIIYLEQNNMGVSYSRNKGIKLSTSDYLFFMDADDELPVDAIHTLVTEIRNDTDIVIGNWVYRVGSRQYKNSTLKAGEYSGETQLDKTQVKYDMFVSNGRPLATVCNKLYKRSFLVQNKITFERDVIAEDRLFNLCCYVMKPNIVVTNHYTYTVNVVENSRSRSYNKDFYNDSISLIEYFKNYLELSNSVKKHDDLLFFTVIMEFEKVHRHIIRYSNEKSADVFHYTWMLRKHALVNLVLAESKRRKYFHAIRLNGKGVFLMLYSFLIQRFPRGIYACFLFADLILNVRHQLRKRA